MRNIELLLMCGILLIFSTVSAQDTPPVLEEYEFQLNDWPDVELSFHDPKLGPGGAQFRIELRPAGRGSSRIRLEVFRHIPKDQIAFALLLEQIRLQFVDENGDAVKTVVLDKILGENGLFIIGDSNDGYFEHRATLSGLRPARQLKVTLFGNFE